MEEINKLDDVFKKALGGFEASSVPLPWLEVQVGILETQVGRLKQQNLLLKIALLTLGLLTSGAIMRLIWHNTPVSAMSAENILASSKTNADTVWMVRTVTQYDTIRLKQVVYVPQPYINEQYTKNNITATNAQFASLYRHNSLSTVGTIENPQNEIQKENLTKLPIGATKQESSHPDEITNPHPQLSEHHRLMGDLESLALRKHLAKFRLPIIKYDIPFALVREIYRKEEKTPLTERLYGQIDLAETVNQLKVKGISESKNNGKGTNMGVGVGLQLNNRFGIRTGLVHENCEFPVPDNTIHSVSAENYIGTPTFVYRTPFGNAILPTDQLEYKPLATDNLIIEPEDEFTLSFWKVPIVLTYNLSEHNIRLLGGYSTLQPYILGGGYLQVPHKQNLKAEVYAPDGEEVHVDFSKLKGISNLAFGGTLGLGSNLYLGNKTSLTTEAYLYHNFTHMISNEYYQSSLWGGGVKVGLRRNFK